MIYPETIEWSRAHGYNVGDEIDALLDDETGEDITAVVIEVISETIITIAPKP